LITSCNLLAIFRSLNGAYFGDKHPGIAVHQHIASHSMQIKKPMPPGGFGQGLPDGMGIN